MGIKNPEVLYTSGCRAILFGSFCGKPADDHVHDMPGGHIYQD